MTALMEAALHQRDNIYQKLLQHGANENARDEYGRDAHFYAELGKKRTERSSSSDDNYLTSPAHIANPLNIYNPWR